MAGAIFFTVLLFVVGCAMCVTLNYVMFKFWWDGVATWVKYTIFVGCITIIFTGVYYANAYLWGAADV